MIRLKHLVFIFVLTTLFVPMFPGSGMSDPAAKVETDSSFFFNLPENIRLLPPITADEAEKKISDYARSVDVLEADFSLQEEALEKPVTKELQADIDNYKTLISIYQQILAALNKKTALENDLQLINEKKEQAEASITTSPPYSLGFYDSHMVKLTIAEQRQQDIEISKRLPVSRLRDISEDIEKNEKNIRLIKEKQTTFLSEQEKINAGHDLKQIVDQKAILEAKAQLYLIQLKNMETEKEIANRHVGILYRQMIRIKKLLSFDENDLENQLNTIDARRTALEELLNRVLDEQKQVETAWKNAREAADVSISSPAADAWVAAREAWRTTYQAVIEQTSDIIRILDFEAQVWRLRYELLNNGLTVEEMAEWKINTKEHISEIIHVIALEQKYQNTLRQQIIDVEGQLREVEADSVITGHYKTRIAAMNRLSERRVEYISALLENQQLVMRFQDEINNRLDRKTLREKFTGLLTGIENVWNYEVWVIDGNGVTVRKLTAAMVLLILGLLLVKILFNTVFKRILASAHIQETNASAAQKILSYFAYLLVLLFAMRIVNIPLAAFAFLGGAIAIGLGFGAQNLINNFISGFILMGERPISIGDLIEIDSILGKVEEIGARCTRVRTGENIHILVPNSSLLEKNITNWTLSDKRIRTHVRVGVVYGSDVKQVKKLLIHAVKDNPRVFQSPGPFVLFNDFGDNALIFDVYFWIGIDTVIERKTIESAIRFRIETLFSEASIVIAFPQRDVHLDATEPLRLELLGGNVKEDKV